MKKFLSVIVSILSIFATSCQSEENEVRQSEDSFTKNSTVATLVKRVAQAPTKIDDVVDGSDDFSVKLPVTITLNNQEIKITSTDDYGYVQFVKNKSNLDNDVVSFHFPIVVTKPNFEEQTINNQSQYNDFLASCNSTENHEEIKCLRFNYPISVKKYNTNNQVINTLSITSDDMLYSYLDQLSNTDVVGFGFPLSVTKPDNSNETVTTKSQLESLINSSNNQCTSYYIGNFEYYFKKILTSNNWYISYFYHDNQNETNYYTNYSCTFNNNYTISAVYNSSPYAGNWSFHDEGNHQELDIQFSSPNLNEIDEDWHIDSFSQKEIKLSKSEFGEDSFLTFSKL